MRRELKLLWVLLPIIALALTGCGKGSDEVVGPEGIEEGVTLGKPGAPPADPAIVFSAGENLEQLTVMNTDGSNKALIFKDGRTIFHPSWSPDAKTVAFARRTATGAELWLVDVAVVGGKPQGSNARMLLASCNTCRPAWSPLGNEIAIANNPAPSGEARDIQVIAVAGGTPVTLYTDLDGLVDDPTWSQDGMKIAFRNKDVLGSTGKNSIKVIDRMSGAVLATLVEGQFFVYEGVDWARTQERIAFAAAPLEGGQNVYWVDIATGIATFVTAGRFPTWSPDDTQIVFQKKEKTQFKLKKITLSTGSVIELARDGWYPDWRRF